MAIGNVIAKTAGATGLGLTLFTAHKAADMVSEEYSKEKTTAGLAERYKDTLSLSSPNIVEDAVKKSIFKFDMDTNFDSTFYKIKGYFQNLGAYLMRAAIPLSLSAGAFFTKGIFSKASAIGLAAYSGYYVLQKITGKED